MAAGSTLPGLTADDRRWRSVAQPPLETTEDRSTPQDATGRRQSPRKTILTIAISVVAVILLWVTVNAVPAIILACCCVALVALQQSPTATFPEVEESSTVHPAVVRTDFIDPQTTDIADRAVQATTTLAASPLAAELPQAKTMLTQYLYQRLADLRAAESAGTTSKIRLDVSQQVTVLERLAHRARAIEEPGFPMPTTTEKLGDEEFLHWIEAALDDNHA